MKILAVSDSGGLGIAPLTALERCGVKIGRIALSAHRTQRFGGLSGKLDRYFPGADTRHAITEAISSFQPDIIHVGFGRPSALTVLSALDRNQRTPVVFEHGSIGGLNILGPFDWATIFNRRIDCIVVPTLAVINHWAGQPLVRHAIGIERCHAIPHAMKLPAKIDKRQRQKLRERLGFRPEEFVVGTVCANRPIKNLAFVAQIVRQLGAPFVFAHVGPHRSQRERDQLVAMGGDRLRMLGFRSDAARLNAAFDLFVSPTLPPGESFGLAPAEAMANGVPVIASTHGGTACIFEEGVSGLALPLKSDRWVSAIDRLSRQPDCLARMGRAARRRIADRFNADLIAARFAALYETLISGD